MNNSHLSVESEYRYIIQWFRDFSEYEKSDFQEILLKWLLKNEAEQVNGISENGTKPTIFHCRMKLFKEWSSKWPDQLRSKLIDKLNELDPDFGTKLNETLEARLENLEETNNNTAAEEGAVTDNSNSCDAVEESIVPTTNGCSVNGEKEALVAEEEESLQNGITTLSVNEE